MHEKNSSEQYQDHVMLSNKSLPVRLSVRLSVTRVDWISQKRLKLGSCNFHHRVALAQTLLFLQCKFNPEILTGSPERGVKHRWGGKNKLFSSFVRRYLMSAAG